MNLKRASSFRKTVWSPNQSHRCRFQWCRIYLWTHLGWNSRQRNRYSRWVLLLIEFYVISWTPNLVITRLADAPLASDLARPSAVTVLYKDCRQCCSKTSLNLLTHWGRDKMDGISQTTFWGAFSWMKMCEFRLNFHWILFLRVQLTIFQHWFR